MARFVELNLAEAGMTLFNVDNIVSVSVAASDGMTEVRVVGQLDTAIAVAEDYAAVARKIQTAASAIRSEIVRS